MDQATHYYLVFETAGGFCGIAWSSVGITRFQLPTRSPRSRRKQRCATPWYCRIFKSFTSQPMRCSLRKTALGSQPSFSRRPKLRPLRTTVCSLPTRSAHCDSTRTGSCFRLAIRPGRSGAGCRAWRAFLFAGAKALLVSNWYVASDAAARLMASTFDIFARDPTIGRSEALRRAMIEALDQAPGPVRTHPLFWAPFVVVGDGGPSR